jgi:hypothetical protein
LRVLGVCFRFFIARNSTVTPSLKFTLARRFLAADYPSGRRSCARVALGDCSPRAPTDPDVPDYGIRLFTTWIRYAMSL